MIKQLFQAGLVLMATYTVSLLIRSIVAPEEQEDGAIELGLPIDMLGKALGDFILVRDTISDLLAVE